MTDKKVNDGGAIQPVKVERDKYGMWTHPDFPDSEEEYIPRGWFSDRGLEFKVVEFSDDAPEDLIDKWFGDGDCDCIAWEPSIPAGDGWFMFSIHDTEDGPICAWVRRIDEKASEAQS